MSTIRVKFAIRYLTAYGEQIVVQREDAAEDVLLVYDTQAQEEGLWRGETLVHRGEGKQFLRYRYALRPSVDSADVKPEFIDGWREVSLDGGPANEISLLDCWVSPGLVSLLSSGAAKQTLFASSSEDDGRADVLEAFKGMTSAESSNPARTTTLVFRVLFEPRLDCSDCSIAVTGNLPSLGSWNPKIAPVMKRGPQKGEWNVSVTLSEEDRTVLSSRFPHSSGSKERADTSCDDAATTPLEYKYALHWNDETAPVWETGSNRQWRLPSLDTAGSSASPDPNLNRPTRAAGGTGSGKPTTFVLSDNHLRLPTGPCMDDAYRASVGKVDGSSGASCCRHGCASAAWKGAGVAVPLFSLVASSNADTAGRASIDDGCGDFRALTGLISWASSCGLRSIYLAPVNDTGSSPSADPYSPISSCALHPAYINIAAALEWIDDKRKESVRREDALPATDRPASSSARWPPPSSCTSPTNFPDPPLPPSPPSNSPTPFTPVRPASSDGFDARPALHAQSASTGTSASANNSANSSEERAGSTAAAATWRGWIVPASLRARITRGGRCREQPQRGQPQRQFSSSSSSAFVAHSPPRLSRSPSWSGGQRAGLGSAPSVDDGGSVPLSAFSSTGGSSSSGAIIATAGAARPTMTPVDWDAVSRDKMSVLRALFSSVGDSTLQTKEFGSWFRFNRDWLRPYALFCFLRDTLGSPNPNDWGTKATGKITDAAIAGLTDPSSFHFNAISFHFFCQFLAHMQLQAAAEFARRKKVLLCIDVLSSGMPAASVDAWAFSRNFVLGKRCGVPPDKTEGGDAAGQPFSDLVPFNWQFMASGKGDSYSWWKMRLRHLSQYFGGIRFFRAVDLFRSFMCPDDAVLSSARGFFSPLAPVLRLIPAGSASNEGAAEGETGASRGRRRSEMIEIAATQHKDHTGFTAKELDALGITQEQLSRLCEPYLREWTLRSSLGADFASVASRFLRLQPTDHRPTNGASAASGEASVSARYVFKARYRSERAIAEALQGTPDEWLAQPLVALFNNVCLLAVKGGEVVPYLPAAGEEGDSNGSDGEDEGDERGGSGKLSRFTFHPRVGFTGTTAFFEASAEVRKTLLTVSALYFDASGLQQDLWPQTGLKRLSALLRITKTLPLNGEEGNSPSSSWSPVLFVDNLGGGSGAVGGSAGPGVARCRDVLRHLGILGSECHRSPSSSSLHQGGHLHNAGSSTAGFSDPLSYEYGSIAMTSAAFFSSPLRQWWEEDRTAAMAFYRAFVAPGAAGLNASGVRDHCHDLPLSLFGSRREPSLSFYSRSSHGSDGGGSRNGSEKDFAAASSTAKTIPGSGMGLSAAAIGSTSVIDADKLPSSCTCEAASSLLYHYSRSGSILTVFPLQDILALDSSLRAADPFERIGLPAVKSHVWRWRMPVSLEELGGEEGRALRAKLRAILAETGRLGVIG